MATRGAKPKPAHLRLIDGTRNATRHGSEADLRKKADTGAEFGPLIKPKFLKGEAAKVWAEMIAPAGWLDGSRKASAIAFCQLWSEFMEAPKAFPSAKHGQMRAYLSELGLTDERNRIGREEKSKDEFFDD